MAIQGDHDYDEFDIMDDYDDAEPAEIHAAKHRSRDVRRELDRRLELRRLRELLGDDEIYDFD